jgi:hypothetical protein
MSKSLVTMLALLFLVALLAGCAPPLPSITGSGNIVTRQEDISGFDKVDVGNAFKVDIRQGEAFSVVVRVDDNLVDKLVVEKRGSRLVINLRPAITFLRTTQEAEITMPELAGLDLSGATEGHISGFASSGYIDVDVSGASELWGDIEAGDARIDASGASEVSLQGSAGDVIVSASGASTIDLSDFAVADANVEASGASKVTVNASGRLDADASGASDVRYLGNPTLGGIDTSGASSIRPR